MGDIDPNTEWYWDLDRKVAVAADERGPGDHTMGPYRTKGEAENLKTQVESRNQAWDEDDEKWESRADDEGDGGEGSPG